MNVLPLNTNSMLHIRNIEAEPIIAIQRVRNLVYMEDESTLVVTQSWRLNVIKNIFDKIGIKSVIIVNKNQISLDRGYYFNPPRVDSDEIVVMKGIDDIVIKDELGNEIGAASDNSLYDLIKESNHFNTSGIIQTKPFKF